MIELCLHLVVIASQMKNARQEIQEITNEVTQFTNEEDGAVLFLESKFLK